MARVAVVGAAGYAGIETVRWVLNHPHLELTHVTSAADEGRALAALYPQFEGHSELAFVAPDISAIIEAADTALLAVPHTAALKLVPDLVDAGVTVIDLSADYRLNQADVYEAWYGVKHTSADLLEKAVYGLPELDRSGLAGASLVACPGCYPTAATLAALPALAGGVTANPRVIVDAKSGVSGAGRVPGPATHYCSVDESLAPYKVGSHRHTPEMEQAMTRAAGSRADVMFTPHLVPMSRGLLATVYLEVEEGLDAAAAHALYEERYRAEPFVRVCEPGAMPSTHEVVGTNMASVGVTVDAHTSTLVAVCAIDNLGKGAAGQAIQCLNAVLGLPETEGLHSVGPVV